MKKYWKFLGWILVLSIPFYLLGILFPVGGLPFGLPISFLMISVPFVLAIREKPISYFINELRPMKLWALIFSICAMPLAVYLASDKVFSLNILDFIVMFILYFIGSIFEEVAWTSILTKPFSDRYGMFGAGIIIGFVWAIWHVIPWSFQHPPLWIAGMILLNLIMRTSMVFGYMKGGMSLISGLLFHTMINVSLGFFPNVNVWWVSIWLLIILLLTWILVEKRLKESEFVYFDE